MEFKDVNFCTTVSRSALLRSSKFGVFLDGHNNVSKRNKVVRQTHKANGKIENILQSSARRTTSVDLWKDGVYNNITQWCLSTTLESCYQSFGGKLSKTSGRTPWPFGPENTFSATITNNANSKPEKREGDNKQHQKGNNAHWACVPQTTDVIKTHWRHCRRRSNWEPRSDIAIWIKQYNQKSGCVDCEYRKMALSLWKFSYTI